MSIYLILGLLLFVIVSAALLIRYVHASVDREFRDLARAVSDAEYRGDELARVDTLLDGRLPLPADVPAVARPSGTGRGFFPPVLMAVGIILLWGGAFAREEKTLWLYAGLFATLLAAVIMLATLRRRKWERTARLLRFRADLRRLDANYRGSAGDLRELVRLTPWDDAAWAELSDDLAADGKLDEALDAMGQAARLDPRYDEYRMLEASLAIRLGRLDAARTAIGNWTALDGVEADDPRLVIYQAALDLAEGRRDKAAGSLRRLLLDEDGQSLEFLDTDKALEGVKELLPGRE